jgi:cytochrome c551/c552
MGKQFGVKLVTVALGIATACVSLADNEKAALDYRLNCEGCHRPNGEGVEPEMPALQDNLLPFLSAPGGREYLIRVPGVRQAALSDADVASLMNWILSEFPANPGNVEISKFTAEEVSDFRAEPYLNVARTRRLILKAHEAGADNSS